MTEVVVNPAAVTEPHPDGAVVVDSETFGYVELDRTGAAMWDLLRATGDVEAVLDGLEARYAAPREVLARDLEVFVARLRDCGLVLDGRPDPRPSPPPSPADLYLDLVERSVTGLLQQRVQGRPLSPQAHLGLRVQGRDLATTGLTLVGLPRLRAVRHLVERVLADDVPGDLVECGVWRGGTSLLMRAVLAAHGVIDRTVWLADSFQGLPAVDPDAHPADADWGFLTGQLAVPVEDVQRHFEAYGLLDDQVRFLPGWFADTLPDAPIERIALLRLDGDLYGSTMDTLVNLHPRVSAGGFVVVDDWALEPCRQACEDYRAAHGITSEVVPSDWCGAWWRVE